MSKKNKKPRAKNAKSSKQNKQPKIKRMTPEEIDAVVTKLTDSNVEDEVTEFVKAMMNGNEWLCDQAEKGLLTIAKLRKLFQIQGSEKAVNRNPHLNKASKSENDFSESEDEKTKGHGRNSADSYGGAETVNILHPELKPATHC